jgi:hypothetical protein
MIQWCNTNLILLWAQWRITVRISSEAERYNTTLFTLPLLVFLLVFPLLEPMLRSYQQVRVCRMITQYSARETWLFVGILRSYQHESKNIRHVYCRFSLIGIYLLHWQLIILFSQTLAVLWWKNGAKPWIEIYFYYRLWTRWRQESWRLRINGKSSSTCH